MPDERRNKCHIIAPIGLETSALVDVLQQLGVSTGSMAELSPVGYADPAGLRRTLKAVDFAVAVVSSMAASTVLFELGVAVGINKPVFLILVGADEVPFALQKIPSVRVEGLDEAVIRFHLKQFIKQLGYRSVVGVERVPLQGENHKVRFSQWLSSKAPAPLEQDLEAQVADALKAAGVVTSLQPVLRGEKDRTMRPDFIAWFEGMPESLGNPVILEVKKRAAPTDVLALNQVFGYVKAAGVRTGLLIVESIANDEIGVTAEDGGYVFTLSSRRLFSELLNQSLYQTLLMERNLHAHGGHK